MRPKAEPLNHWIVEFGLTPGEGKRLRTLMADVPPDGTRKTLRLYFAKTVFRVLTGELGALLDGTQQRARRDRAAADKLEMENAITARDLVWRSEVMAHVVDDYSRVSKRLTQIPDAVAVRVPREHASAVREAISAAIDEAISELRADELTDVPDGARTA